MMFGTAKDPELFFGLVGAVGTDLEQVERVLEEKLKEVDYTLETVRLSKLLDQVSWLKPELSDDTLDRHIETRMNAGDQLRRQLQRGDALALLALGEVRQRRAEIDGVPPERAKPASRRAYVFRSLKHRVEVDTLRFIYGNRFVLISAHAPRERRLRTLTEKIAESHREGFNAEKYRDLAEKLSNRDEQDTTDDFGQDVRHTFSEGDMFIDAGSRASTESGLERLVRILFGYPFETPSRDEYAMFQAKAAELRSAAMGRQVGASIATPTGDIVALGANDVPKPFGGLYWAGDDPDHREFRHGEDANDRVTASVVAELLDRFKRSAWFEPAKSGLETPALIRAATEGPDAPLHGARVGNLLEFSREVHAEMSALCDAARRGVSTSGMTMFVTTFPCHGCAKHILAAGIRRVVYVAPYPKSLVAKLFPDLIEIEGEGGGGRVGFAPFVGVSPRRYVQWFEMRKRKDEQGRALPWSKRGAQPRFLSADSDYVQRESLGLKEIAQKLSDEDGRVERERSARGGGEQDPTQ